MKRKGWFKIEGQEGDRTLTQQMQGLAPLLQMVRGKSVLDIGCAEGLISITLHEAGARMVHGIEVVKDHVKVGNALRGSRNVSFEVADANDYRPTRRYDIVIMLAVLHKLRDPAAACIRFADAAIEACVIRLPPPDRPRKDIAGRGPCSVADIEVAMAKAGFKLRDTVVGPNDEPTFYWTRT